MLCSWKAHVTSLFMRFSCAFVKIYYLYEENSLCYSIFVRK